MRRKEFTDYPFEKEKFSKALKKACGDRTLAEFCRMAGLSYSHISKYANEKLDVAPTVGTIKKITGATKTATYKELLIAAGYDAEKYKYERTGEYNCRDFIYPVFLGMANSSFDWRIESKGYKDNEPFEILIERADVNKWFFIPVLKKDITKEDIQNILMNQPKITPGSKVSFVTDDPGIYETIKAMEFPLLSLYISVIRVKDHEILDEVSINTSISTDMTIVNVDKLRPFVIVDS